MRKKVLVLTSLLLLLLTGVTLAIVLPLTLGKTNQPQGPEPKSVTVTVTHNAVEYGGGGVGGKAGSVDSYKWFTKNGEQVTEEDYSESTMSFTAKAGDKVIFGLYLDVTNAGSDRGSIDGLESLECDETDSVKVRYGIDKDSYSQETASKEEFTQAAERVTWKEWQGEGEQFTGKAFILLEITINEDISVDTFGITIGTCARGFDGAE